MPGAPTGRACNACRKLKKKCDQKQPSCSRCTRLRIPCVGSGQLRYKFMGQSFGESPGSSSEKLPSPTSSPSNELTRLVGGFSSLLEVDDPGIDITIYGPFIDEIPKRLGRNEALDSAAAAFLAAFPTVRSRELTKETYQVANYAVNKLRTSLDDPLKASQPETLCAVYMTMITQGWLLRRDDYYAGHGEAIVHLVNQASRAKYSGLFEKGLLVTLQVLVVIVSLIDSSMKPDMSAWDAVPQHLGPIPPIDAIATVESLKLHHMAKVMRMTRDFDNNIPGLRFAYDLMKSDAIVMSNALHLFEEQVAECKVPRGPRMTAARKLHVRYQNSYGVLLYIAITLHRGLDRIGMLGESKDADLDYFVRESINLTQQAMQYRPLGSSSVPFCLAISYAISPNEELRFIMDQMLADWEGDFEATRWRDLALCTRSRMHEPGWLFLTDGRF